jgi:hypothetical protein
LRGDLHGQASPGIQRPLTGRWPESLDRRALPLLRSGDTQGDSHEP